MESVGLQWREEISKTVSIMEDFLLCVVLNKLLNVLK